MKKQAITVFCGSADGNDPVYAQVAAQLGETLAREGRRLIYGAGCRGLMGAVAKAAVAHGGHVTGVNIARFSNPKYIMQVDENIVADTIQERKMRMLDLCDALVVLPGGIGTLDEMFEVLSMLQLGLTNKPLGILNVNGFYDPLLKFMEQITQTGFFNPKYAKIIIIRNTVEELLAALDETEDITNF